MNQLELFRRIPPAWYLATLGRLMFLANAGRYDGKQYFYWSKTEILRRYGTKVKDEVQRIRHTCHTCDGTGRWHYWQSWRAESCDHCQGTGTWEYLFVRLGVYELGGRTFHVPFEREKEDRWTKREYAIKGKIKHPDVDRRVAWWSALAIIVISDHPRCWRGFIQQQLPSRFDIWNMQMSLSYQWQRLTDKFHELDVAPWDERRHEEPIEYVDDPNLPF